MTKKYKRILLKLSGEALAGQNANGINEERLLEYAYQLQNTVSQGIELGIVIGGGNIFRGLAGVEKGFDRVKGDQMGMLATVINSLALQSALESIGQKAIVLTSIRMEPIGRYYSSSLAIEYMREGTVAIIAGGTGNPFFTTDTAAALRAVETKADVLLKGTRVDGVYSADPEKHPDAEKFDTISFDEVYHKNLKIMDLTSFTLCKTNQLPIVVFDMNTKGNLQKIIKGENCGTLVTI